MKAKTISILTAIIMALSFTTIMPMSIFAEDDDTDYIHFKELDDGTLEVSSCGDQNIGPDVYQLVVPSEVDGKTVTRIGNYSFHLYHHITDLVLPDTITEIGQYAFSANESLEKVTLPKNLKTIGYNAFVNCIALKDIILPEGLEVIGGAAFSGCKSLTTIRIPDSVTTLGTEGFGAFYGCTNLTEVYIGNGITDLSHTSFLACENLTRLVIGRNVNESLINALLLKNNPTSVYYWCPTKKLSEIIVDENNETFSTVDGVLFNKDKTKLIFYPNKDIESYTVPDSVEEISHDAFNIAGRTIKSITLPDGLKVIKDRAFVECYDLPTLAIPTSVEEIGEDAFKYSPVQFYQNDIVLECYYDSYARQYAIENNLKYRLLDDPMPQLVKYQLRANDDGTTDTRFILIADEQEVMNAKNADVYATIDGTDTDAIVVDRAYRSIVANGKKITADEGKVFLIGKFVGIPDDMVSGMTAHFTLGENTYNRTIAS